MGAFSSGYRNMQSARNAKRGAQRAESFGAWEKRTSRNRKQRIARRIKKTGFPF